jgi:putative toxin-antitoxin system antitoxin component (TIGR02293 family)
LTYIKKKFRRYDMTYQAIFRILGLKLLTRTPFEMVNIARKGIPMKAIDTLAKNLNLSRQELAKYLPVSERTLQRYTPEKILSQDLSDRILQIAKVYARCVEIFEGQEKASGWLKQSNIAFGKIPPIELLDTSTGIEMVSDELTRIEYGVAS